ncbi:aminotransferase class V-fold PLP-dependent enzyme [Streptomyces sp. LP05-1]|uniref:Aminotransferase class V-fold PLP-dependent enzyme n=1 Tax=Streptomyces pyxinae TaxID=2970734 RepID=A0ABT2CL55_9ACTN|nr:aminotransferase class V-fold PLP-dependent enzyme [Streptomyces sp. LP05-1]MCS0637294.1 aminotransferase class V-fold PLP-dependent enzyme [Streptomyces sp. LP05-1]
METRLGGAEFAPAQTYLNTSACGLLPRRAVAAITALTGELAAGRPGASGSYEVLEAVRASFGRIAGAHPDRVALGSSVAGHVGLVAAALPPGAEVLLPEGDFVSLSSPFTTRGDLKTRFVPLTELAGAVRPGTALVALSSVQSADGRIADLAAIRAAARAHGARTLVDLTQSMGWLPLETGAYDYTVTAGFKYLMCPRGASFLTVTEEAQESLPPHHPGWFAAGDPDAGLYDPIPGLARSARRYDDAPAYLSYYGAEQSLALLEEVGVAAAGAHATALAARFRAGLAALGRPPVPADGSVVVSVPGLAERHTELLRAGVITSARAGGLRASFHLYNSAADVDRALEVLAAGR